MDTVKALNTYRKSIASDANAFEVLCLIYKDEKVSESELRESVTISAAKLKQTLRELYQSNLLNLASSNRYFLTPFAEGLLSKMGVDKLVISFLLQEVADEPVARKLQNFVDWTHGFEPERTQSTLRSLRNFRSFVGAFKAPEDERNSLLWLCAVHPDSQVRVVLKNRLLPSKLLSEGLENNQTSATARQEALEDAERAATILDELDAALVTSCSKVWEEKDYSFSSKLVSSLTFRYFNYIASPERDHILEACHVRMRDENRTKLTESILARFPNFDRWIQTIEYFFPFRLPVASMEGFLEIVDRVLSAKISARLDVSLSLSELQTRMDTRFRLKGIGPTKEVNVRKRFRRRKRAVAKRRYARRG
jgi:hypothetical protein